MEARGRTGSPAPIRRRDLDRLIEPITTDSTIDLTVEQQTEISIDPGPLLEWFAEHGRDLPWRATRDPWAILVSELMLQQTQAARVAERLPRFLERFPTPMDCAEAGPGAVIEEWQGLGYNRRALYLHRAAVAVVAEYAGSIPSDLRSLLALPGVGQYTARAVRVFAFELDDGVLDTNIGRLLARLVGEPLRPRAAQELADSLVPSGLGWEWNQAIMEVGALRCRPKPHCDQCPLQAGCGWHVGGRSEPDPARTSAGVSGGRSRFDGSDRQGRGRLVDALRIGPVAVADLASVMGWPSDQARARTVADSVIGDGLAIEVEAMLRLP